MRFSTRTTYGLRAMIRLAKNWPKKNIPLPRIAAEENLPLKYLERLFSKLKKAGVVNAEKGAAGGYGLRRAPDKIIVYDIIKPLEGSLSLFYCLKEDARIDCGDKTACGASIVLASVQTSIIKTLKSITLGDLV